MHRKVKKNIKITEDTSYQLQFCFEEYKTQQQTSNVIDFSQVLQVRQKGCNKTAFSKLVDHASKLTW